MANDAESGLAPAKRVTPLNTGVSDTEASNKLDKLTAYLGLENLASEEGPQGLVSTPFIGTIDHSLFSILSAHALTLPLLSS